MSLIKCPECGRDKVSSSAKVCPDCGFGIAEWYSTNSIDLEDKKTILYKGKKYTVGELNREALYIDQKNGNYDTSKEKWFYLLETEPENNFVKRYVNNNLGFYYLEDFEYDIKKAMKYISIAAKMGEPEAEAMLGNIYNPKLTEKKFGYSEFVDINKAIEWYHKAANHGHIYAMNNLGVLYGDYKNQNILAALYCWIAFKCGNKGSAENNYLVYSKNIPYEYLSLIRKCNTINDVDNFIINIEEHENNKPKCPTCKSTNICAISGTRRFISTGIFGLASADIGKSMRCKNCGYRW